MLKLRVDASVISVHSMTATLSSLQKREPRPVTRYTVSGRSGASIEQPHCYAFAKNPQGQVLDLDNFGTRWEGLGLGSALSADMYHRPGCRYEARLADMVAGFLLVYGLV